MTNLNLFLFYFLIFSIVFQFSLADEIDPDKSYSQNYENIIKEINLTLSINKQKSKTSGYYLHFKTIPLNPKNPDFQQIIYSSLKERPSTRDTYNYSFRYSTYANLAVFAPNDTDTIYLTIKCLKYPCSFNFEAMMEKNCINLTLDGTHDYYFYNSNSLGKEKLNKINFTFPFFDSTNNKNIDIAVINPGDIEGDFVKLSYAWEPTKDSEGPIYIPIKERTKFEKGIILSINGKMEQANYFLEIESSENQFITLSIKISYNKTVDYYESEIIPNTVGKCSSLTFNSEINECFKINQDYINNFLNDNQQTNFLFASIEFFTLPKMVSLNYSNNIIDIKNENKYLNVILKKEDKGYPQVCFNTKDTIFNIEISHLYQNMENIDIYSPIFSGSYNQKTLMADSLGVYTHNSDIHFVQKISFYLKPLKGKPEMYILQCDDYPNCPNKINDLKKVNADKAEDFGNFQFYSKKYDKKTKDLSPYGYSQNLLYVYCPSNTENEYCQFEILIYSDLDEIVLEENKDFNTVTTKDDELMFKIVFKKGHDKFKDISFCVNVEEKDFEFNTFEDINSTIIEQVYIYNMVCYKYILDEQKINNLDDNDIEIIFNIISNKDLNYTLKSLKNIISNEKEIGDIIKDEQFFFPCELNYLIGNTTSDLLFNIFLNDKNQIFNFDNIEINAIILNETYLKQLQEGNEISILDGAKIEKLDQATRTAVLYIKKEEIKDIIGEDKENKYYLHFVIINNGQKNNQELTAKMFLLEKQMDEQYILEKDNFLYDKLTFDNSSMINLYHIKMENNPILEIKFTSNYPIESGFLVYFIDYHNDTNIDIHYLERNQKNFIMEEIGQMYNLSLDNEASNLDITFAVVSNLEIDNIDNISISDINYMFKYNIYSNMDESNRRIPYIFKENYTLTEKDNKSIFEFYPVKKNRTPLNNEIYIRQVLEKDLIANESISTFAKIESEYEMIEGNKSESNETIKITVPRITEENCSFSILIDIPNENEKFVISNKVDPDIEPSHNDTDTPSSGNNTDTPPDTSNQPSQPDNTSEDDYLVLKIVIPIVSVILVIGIVFLILYIRKKRGAELKQSILKTSFQEGDSNERALITTD